MKCICAVLLHKTSVRGKRNTLETCDSSWLYDCGRKGGKRRKEKAAVCSLRGISKPAVLQRTNSNEL
jgi:hypothetical protein